MAREFVSNFNLLLLVYFDPIKYYHYKKNIIFRAAQLLYSFKSNTRCDLHTSTTCRAVVFFSKLK